MNASIMVCIKFFALSITRMDSLKEELEQEMARSRVDKTALYQTLLKMVELIGESGGASQVAGPKGPKGDPGVPGPSGPAGPAGPAGKCECKCTATAPKKAAAPKKTTAAKKTATVDA
jgi:hypothetical protein